MSFDVGLQHGRARRDTGAVGRGEHGIGPAAPAVEPVGHREHREVRRSEEERRPVDALEECRHEADVLQRQCAELRLTDGTARTSESESAFRGLPSKPEPARTCAQVAPSALHWSTFVPGCGTSPQSGSCERRSDERPIEPTGRSSRPTEPTGIEPTGTSPRGSSRPGSSRPGPSRPGPSPRGPSRPGPSRPASTPSEATQAAVRRSRHRAREEREPRVRDLRDLHRRDACSDARGCRAHR